MEPGKKENIKNNFDDIKKKINGIKLVAVTKKATLEEVKILKELGHSVFGENRVNDAQQKINEIEGEWRMIGHLQSNKVGRAVELFDSIDSVDSLKLAKKISEKSQELGKKMEVLIQVNIGREEQKHGIIPEETLNFIEKIKDLEGVEIKGLMAIAPFTEKENTRSYFKEMRKIFESAKNKFDNIDLRYLSMGMSNDYEIAIEEGANMVRIGTSLFK